MEKKGKKDEFKLPIGGLDVGNHEFTLICDKTFFEISEISELQDGKLNLQLDMEKKENMLDLHFHFAGEVEALCDRCLDPVCLPLGWEDRLIVKILPKGSETGEDDSIWIIHEDTHELDLFHFVYESIKLALPLQIVHPDDKNGNSTCDPEVLKKLENLAAREAGHDPRWDALKQIK